MGYYSMESSDYNRCNKCPIPQISHWCNELYGNEVDPSMINEEINLTMHQGGLWVIQRI
jgi:hypothetical protein